MLEAAKIKNWIAIALLPVFIAVIFAANEVANMGGSAERVLGAAVVLTWFFWQIDTIGKVTIRTRDVVGGVPCQDPAYDRLIKRQQLYALALLGIGDIYLIVAFAGCLSLLVN